MKKIILILVAPFILAACAPATPQPDELSKIPEGFEEEFKEESEPLEELLIDESEVMDPVLPELPEEIVFDSCGTPSDYNNWYFIENLQNQLAKIPHHRYERPLNALDLDEICHTKISRNFDSEMVIGLYGEAYCRRGFVFRYFSRKDIFQVAQVLDPRPKGRAQITDTSLKDGLEQDDGCNATLGVFGKRQGDIVPVIAGWGDAGCSGKERWDYDIRKNILTLKQSCNGCWEYPEGRFDDPDAGTFVETCTDY